jgi:hypothetical protein
MIFFVVEHTRKHGFQHFLLEEGVGRPQKNSPQIMILIDNTSIKFYLFVEEFKEADSSGFRSCCRSGLRGRGLHCSCPIKFIFGFFSF